MGKPARLDDIVNALQMNFDEVRQYVDRETGEVWAITTEELRDIEEMEESETVDEAEDPQLAAAYRVYVCDERMVELPDQQEIGEWETMREFAESVKQRDAREWLLTAIAGRGAFRMFKDTVARLGLREQWFAFRENALREIAIEWCEDNGIEYTR